MIYRKEGAVVRWENGVLVRVSESGVAIEEGERFECRPEGSSRLAVDPAGVLALAQTIQERATPIVIERLIVTHGVAEHECEGRRWREETQRFHLSLTHGALRALIDATPERLDDVAPIAAALSRAATVERTAPQRLRLAPHVAAALLPGLSDVARIFQTAGGLDGYGKPIVATSGAPWPNWYRPSYRMRPVRMPLNVSIEADSAWIDDALPRALALLAPPAGNTARVLIVDGAEVYPSTIRVERVAGVASERFWYPYAGGSFGAEMVL